MPRKKQLFLLGISLLAIIPFFEMTPDIGHPEALFASPTVSSGSNFYWVGAESYDSSVLSNSGIRGTIQVISTPITGCLSFWVADEMASNTMWGQVGYYICNGSTPVGFYQIWNGTTAVRTGTTSVTINYHQFSMYVQSGTSWAYALDGVAFGSFDMGSTMSSSSYPIEALSEEGLVSAPFTPPQVQFSTALEVLKSGSWYSAPSGYEPYGCGSTGMSCWGVQGNLQNTTLPTNAMIIGGNTSLVTAGALLWNSATPDFSATASPTSLTVNDGALGLSTITVTPANGFAGTVTLAWSTSPAGLNCTLSPTSVVLGSTQTSTLSCRGPAGTYTVSFTATSGSLTHTGSVTYTIQDFTISVSPASLRTPPTLAGNSTITEVSVNGFSGTVSLSFSVSPSGLTCSLTPTTIVSGSGTSTLSCSSPFLGTFTVTVTGTSGSITHLATITVIVGNQPDFTLSAFPIGATVLANSIARSNITLNPVNGFGGTVTLTSSATPTGLICSLSQTSLILGPSLNSTLSCTGTAGTYVVTLTGMSSLLSHSATVTVTVQDFTVTANPTKVTVPSGSTGNSTITVNSLNGFNGTVSLTLRVFPETGLTCILSPTIISGGSGVSMLSCRGSRGNYNVTIIGASGSQAHSVTVAYHQAGKYLLVVSAPSGTQVTIDGVTWRTNSSGMLALQVEDGPHLVSVQSTLPYSLGPLGIPSDIVTSTFAGWDDGNASNPVIVEVGNDTVLTATYKPNIQTSSFAVLIGATLPMLILAVIVFHRRKHVGTDRPARIDQDQASSSHVAEASSP